ncbi:MAG: NAD-dependent epimerase/dehydratase family protein [Phycisphaeraceae bacterium]|nr:NAD-dependent epimerase/dehydratase family protein [Phycisphaeraceae bacterium]
MKVCVVGGTGNISTPIVKLLLEQGHDVTLFNRGQRGSASKDVKVIVGDRKNREDFEAKIKAEKFDVAIDMICFEKMDALSDIRAFAGVSHFIQVSTVCTYGINFDFLPATEDHPLRPITDYGKNKVAADSVFMQAYHRDGFPVTIIKPSTTFGPQTGLFRQVTWDRSWPARIEEGRPLVILGEGFTPHQFLHVNDAAPCFVHVLGREKCIGQTYNMMDCGFTTWKTWHQTAMKVIGKEVELVGVTMAQLDAFDVPGRSASKEIFGHNSYYSNEKILRDIPEFNPQFSLEQAMRDVYLKTKEAGDIPESENDGWEDSLIKKLQSL